MENYIIALFLLLNGFILNLNRIEKRPSGRCTYFLVYLIILFGKKCIIARKQHSNLNFIRKLALPVETKFVLKNENKNENNLTYLKKKYRDEWKNNNKKKKNIVLIEKDENLNENRITYIRNKIKSNSRVKEIEYLSDLQKNFIYILERNNNILLHAKTASGKTTICLFYFILKFYYNCEFVFDEDIQREKYLNKNENINSYNKILLLNKARKKVHRHKLKYTPFSEKYAQIRDIREDTDLLLEDRAKNTLLKKQEKILILSPSKELCVQISHNILSFVGDKNEGIIHLFIDKADEKKQSTPVSDSNLSNKVVEKGNGEKGNERHLRIREEISSLPEHVKSGSGTTISYNNDSHEMKIKNEIDISKETRKFKDALFFVGTPMCFKNYLLSLGKGELKAFLQSIKYVFFDEIDRMFPTMKTRKSKGTKNNMKKKTAYFILETIMYMNKKNLIFIGCSSTLNRELHRKIFKLLYMNRNNAKKKIYILRENNASSNEGMNAEYSNPMSPTWRPLSDEVLESNVNQAKMRPCGGKKNAITSHEENEKDNADINDTESEDERFNLFSPNDEDNTLQKYVIKVKVPNNIHHLYIVVNDQLYRNKMEEAYKIIEHFKNKKVLTLVKNGYSLLDMKKYLTEKNVFSVLLHEKLQISLTGNNKHLDEMCKSYADIKNLEEISLKNEEEQQKKYINKYPIIISSFDSIRGFHINNLDLVLLCNKPKNVNEYIHLSGRVGRRNNIGYSIMLEDERNVHIVRNWLTNIRVCFTKLQIKDDITTQGEKPSSDYVDNNKMVQNEKNKQETKNSPSEVSAITDQGKDNLNYITSCILDELK
ncbi:DEAD box helicase [Plasmodium gonderi]|uniref:ATP-dependent RNA helicase n=1 Tax=Plasmodium gonderi TaxID=77519 RepID=A0A1Y1JLM0_PLAGO|nr:DEAD box helicase [Plasmodium gonderi]GAW83341.1 DEAD box helicase [Plasmodium gonderi]